MDILKIVIGLLFLVVVTSGLAIGDCDRDAITYPDMGGNWIRKADAPTGGGLKGGIRTNVIPGLPESTGIPRELGTGSFLPE